MIIALIIGGLVGVFLLAHLRVIGWIVLTLVAIGFAVTHIALAIAFIVLVCFLSVVMLRVKKNWG